MHPRQESRRRNIKAELASKGGVWHCIDFNDVSITRNALTGLKTAARTMLARHVPHARRSHFTMGDALSLLAGHVYWDEISGRMAMCADLEGGAFCISIPAGHWAMNRAEQAN